MSVTKRVEFTQWFKLTKQQAQIKRQRFLVVLCGDIDWAKTLIEKALTTHYGHLNVSSSKQVNNYSLQKWFIYSESPVLKKLSEGQGVVQQVSQQTFRHKLGGEVEGLIFEDNEFNVDAFAALSGTVKAGGSCFLVLPKNFTNSEMYKKSLFLQRFWQVLTKTPSCFVVEKCTESPIENKASDDVKITSEHDQYLSLEPLTCEATSLRSTCLVGSGREGSGLEEYSNSTNDFLYHCKTSEQVVAVDAVLNVVKGHRGRPLVLTADRGRGKSSALAIACAQLLTRSDSTSITSVINKQHIIITAPNSANVQVFFQQLQLSLFQITGEQFLVDKFKLIHDNGIVEYKPIDQLLLNGRVPLTPEKSVPTLLLVDEAAGFPIPLLTALVKNYHRLVFSSTVHGYEGAGRGFSIKFMAILKKLTQCKLLHINEAIRWAKNDPLEQFVFDSCLLNATVATIKEQDVEAVTSLPSSNYDQTLTFKLVDKTNLLKQDSMLEQIFSTLITAHYQTSANDLKMMLDNTNVDIVTLSSNQNIIAVALLVNEGKTDSFGFNEKDINDVYAGKRRLKNHFLPQALANYCGVENSFNYRYARIMRIAVHPQFQNKEIGQYFLEKISAFATVNKIDFLGTSFGVNAQLLNFWQQCQFSLIRIGFTKDKASGEHSALMLKALSAEHDLVKPLTIHFYQAFSSLLVDEFKSVEPGLINKVLHQLPKELLPIISNNAQKSVIDYYQGRRLYSDCIISIQQLLTASIATKKSCSHELELLIAKVFQKQSNEQLCLAFQLSGKKMLNERLKLYIGNLLADIS